MKVVELHPEDLFDKADRGLLSGEEQLLLDAHLRSCPACRFERAVRSDFEQELGDDALDGVPSLVAGALGALPKAPPVVPPPAPPPAPAVTRSWWRRPVVLLAAASLLIAGGAAAQSGIASGLWKKSTEHLSGLFTTPPQVQASAVIPPVARQAPAPRETPEEAPPSAPPGADAAPGTAPAPSAEPAAQVDAVAPPSAPVALAPPRSVAPGKAAAAVAVAPVPAPAERTAAGPAPAREDEAAAPPVESPASLFERANAARRRGSMGEAAGLYGELQAKHPRSAEARLAVVLLARAQLDQGNARAALAGFDAYLGAGGGSLREEAMAGRAMALGRLGRAAEETRAWEALLAAFPRSSYASLAARRLGSTER